MAVNCGFYQNIKCVTFLLKTFLGYLLPSKSKPGTLQWPSALTNLECCCFYLSYFPSPSGLQSYWLSIRSRFFSPQGLCTCISFCLGPYFCRSFKLGLPHLSRLSLNFTSSEEVSICTYLGRVILLTMFLFVSSLSTNHSLELFSFLTYLFIVYFLHRV